MIKHLLNLLLYHISLAQPTSQLVLTLQEEGAIGVAHGLLLLHLAPLLLLLLRIAQVFLCPRRRGGELLHLPRHPKHHCCWCCTLSLAHNLLPLCRSASGARTHSSEARWVSPQVCCDRRYGPLTLIIALTCACSGRPLKLRWWWASDKKQGPADVRAYSLCSRAARENCSWLGGWHFYNPIFFVAKHSLSVAPASQWEQPVDWRAEAWKGAKLVITGHWYWDYRF